MYEKQIVVDRIEVMADHTVAVRYVVTITEKGLPFAAYQAAQIPA